MCCTTRRTVNTYYAPGAYSILVPTAIMQRPFLYLDGPPALNYGGLGSLRQITPNARADILSQHSNDDDKDIDVGYRLELPLQLLSVYRHPDTLDDDVDSESLADLVGARLAYDTFSSFPEVYKGVTLAGFNMSSEQLFFVNHCVKLCAEKSKMAKRYAPYRSRCIVPLRNMLEFSRAFGCKTGTLMNPPEKCSFW
ncbi:hypothetical protein HPB50_005236 [Hyalomma asiaticum]|uniref:Uncharacterized protein n=1 Tax=Hyalomma asiaticum TaxID=266040 RepID=A0ACB7SCF3_HYAAI|nr:hypothetical protein HPB50_005236 [Hyalomma asiaticum]